MNSYAWTVNEVAALVDLETQLRSLYVEGPTDKHLLEWFFRNRGLDVVGYSITDIDVPPQLLASHDQENSNRGRVLALAHEIERLVPRHKLKVAFVVDSDFELLEGLTGCCGSCALVLTTDGTSIEMYAFSQAWVAKFFALVLARALPAFDVLQFLEPVLVELYLIRFVNRSLRLGLSPVDVCDDCRIEGDKLVLSLIVNGIWSATFIRTGSITCFLTSRRRSLCFGPASAGPHDKEFTTKTSSDSLLSSSAILQTIAVFWATHTLPVGTLSRASRPPSWRPSRSSKS